MSFQRVHFVFTVFLLSVFLVPIFVISANAENVPDWVKNTAKWYGDGAISETEFLNAIKYLIENGIITIESTEKIVETPTEDTGPFNILIPNGNAEIQTGAGFYIPLNAEVSVGTTVVWVNDDSVLHTVQSIDENGDIIGMFNSAPLSTGERFAYEFDESGIYNYFCTIHPWRVGLVTVT